FHDPDAGFYGQVCPDADADLTASIAAFRASGASGTLRIVPSLNALVEKVKIVEAGLLDWAVEMTKVLLLASLGGGELDRVLLFERVTEEDASLHWLRFGPRGDDPEIVLSPLAGYTRLAARLESAPAPDELLID